MNNYALLPLTNWKTIFSRALIFGLLSSFISETSLVAANDVDTRLTMIQEDPEQELRELVNEATKELNAQLRKATEEYSDLLAKRDTTFIAPNISLHQSKVGKLDAQLMQLRNELATNKREQTAIKAELSEGIEPKLIVWCLIQEGKLNHRALSDDELNNPGLILERYLYLLKRRTKELNLQYQTYNEEFKFFYEKTRNLEQVERRLKQKQEEIDKLKAMIEEAKSRLASSNSDWFPGSTAIGTTRPSSKLHRPTKD